VNTNVPSGDGTWKSCCVTADKRAITFFAQFFISVIVLLFCMTQLIRHKECEAQSLYSGIMTLVVGTWLPQPEMNN
jgi:hypothetical protein